LLPENSLTADNPHPSPTQPVQSQTSFAKSVACADLP
jgi:hypothetical protein